MTHSVETIVNSDLILNSQVAHALAVIGDRWAFLIIRDIYLGVRRFEDLRRRSGAARGTLASRLKGLVKNGILYKNPYQDSPTRYEYRLTDKGLDLYPVVLTVWRWETRWGDDEHIPPRLVHTACGKEMEPEFRCSHCHRDIRPQDVSFTAGRGAASARKIPPRFQRRSKNTSDGDGVDRRFFHVLDVIGDRWTGLVVAAAFFGLQRYDDIAAAIGIATNILSDRLKLLVRVGVLVRKIYQDKPVRYEYHLSDKGRDLYAHTVAMHEWANRWLLGKGPKPLTLRHRPCAKPFRSELVCSQCSGRLKPNEVSYDRVKDRRRAS